MERFPQDRLLGIEIENWDGNGGVFWDGVLTRLAPNRTVFGVMNDDAHSLEGVGWQWNEFFVPERNNLPNVKCSIRNGRSLMYSITDRDRGGVMPSVNNITICRQTMAISVEVENYTKIEWFSCGEMVSQENSILVNDKQLMKYVRFVVTGTGGQVFSQPFLLLTA